MTTGRLIGLLMMLAGVLTGTLFGENLQVSDFFTCEEIVQGNPQSRTAIFDNDTEKIAVFMRLVNVYEGLEITWEWVHLSGQEQLSQTQIIPPPDEKGYDFWEEYRCWGILDLSDMAPGTKSGDWLIKATANDRLLGQSEFTFSESTPPTLPETSAEIIPLTNEAAIENVVFNYPSDWYLYDDELADGFCQVWLIDDEGSFISFSIYLTTGQMLDDPHLNQNMIKREQTTLSGLNVDHAVVNVYDDTDNEWYKSSIYQISDYWSLSGKYIFLVSYAPVEKYDKYIGLFSQIFQSVGIILF